jgi:hypothetical protein
MLVFWEKRLVILPTPKTGSTSLMDAVAPKASLVIRRPPQLRHVTVKRYHRFVRPWLEETGLPDARVVALIREPESWLGSWYRYRQRDEVTGTPRSTAGMSFDDFVRGWCQTDRPAFADVGSQERFLQPTYKGQWLDRLFRYEELPTFISYLETELELTITLPLKNVSPQGELSLTPETRALLRQSAAADYEFYETLRPPETP